MNNATLLEAARDVSRETVESEVYRVAAEWIVRLLGVESAGAVALDGAAVRCGAAAPAALDERSLLACVERASSTRRVVVTEEIACVPVHDEGGAHGVLFARQAPGAAFSAADVGAIESLSPFVAAALRNVALFTSLETLVTQEMTRVVEREASMQLVLDSMAEGLLVCDVAGKVGPIRSRAALTWFGEPAPDVKLDAYLGDPMVGPWLAMGFESLAEALLPFELVADQMPKVIVRGDRTYRMCFQPVVEGEHVTQVVVTIRDVTAQIAQERADRMNLELPVIVGTLVRDRPGFQSFVDEVSGLFLRVAESHSFSERQRIVHTLKGSALIYGFSLFGEACHAFEGRVAEDAAYMSTEKLGILEREWLQSLERVSMFLTDDGAASLHISGGDYDVLLDQLAKGIDHEELTLLVRGWREPKVAMVLGPYVAGAREVAAKLEKEVEVVLDDGGLRLPRNELRGFCATLVHVLRNAIDHGLETPPEREAAGKPSAGRLYVGARIDDARFVMRVQDDGRGIDWPRICAKALAVGLPAATERDLVDALFSDGVTTRDVVTPLSGRGVGLAATRARCEELGGTLSVRTESGRGTTFEFSFPMRTAA